jgi:hypothetical protein
MSEPSEARKVLGPFFYMMRKREEKYRLDARLAKIKADTIRDVYLDLDQRLAQEENKQHNVPN